jgi:stage III sporulation protein AA
MGAVERLRALLPPDAAALLADRGDRVTQVRLRSDRPVQIDEAGGTGAMSDAPLESSELKNILAALMEYSVYARQEELDQGFFTLEDGSRVGVCGRMVGDGSRLRMDEIGSACLRVARPVKGSGDALIGHIAPQDGPLRSALLLSPPGLGKTTLLRDIARQLSDGGWCVGIADERHELAACHRGVPALDVGARTDVMDGCPRDQAIARLIRGMAPGVVVADEIGGEDDARALADAVRCGAVVMTSAHASGLEQALSRPHLRSVIEAGVMEIIALLGPRPGMLEAVWHRGTGEGVSAWRRA